MSIKCSVTFVDAYAGQTTRVFEMTDDVLADAAADAADLVTALQAVTKLSVVKATLLAPLAVTPNAVVAGANKDAGGTISGWVTEYSKKASVKIPDPIAGCINADGTLDLTNVSLAAFLELFEETGAKCAVSDGEQIVEDGWIRGRLDEHRAV